MPQVGIVSNSQFTVAGGGDYSFPRYMRTQRYYCGNVNATSFVAFAITANRLYAYPFLVSTDSEDFDRIAFNVTAFVALSHGRCGIYADDGTLYPGDLILDGGEQDTDANGVKETVIAETLTQGLYWLAFLSSGAITVRSHVAGDAYPFLGVDNTLGAVSSFSWFVAQAYGALPDPFTAGGSYSTAQTPLVALRKT